MCLWLRHELFLHSCMCHMHLNAWIRWQSCWRVNAIHFRLWRGLQVRVCKCPMLWLQVLWHAYYLHIITPNSHDNVGHFITLLRCWSTDWYAATKHFCRTVMRSKETNQHMCTSINGIGIIHTHNAIIVILITMLMIIINQTQQGYVVHQVEA